MPRRSIPRLTLTRAEWYDLGGFANPHLYRTQSITGRYLYYAAGDQGERAREWHARMSASGRLAALGG